MKLAASNIAWSAESNRRILRCLSDSGMTGLEIAPTKLFPDRPYERLKEARALAGALYEEYGLRICSMQSIWYGRQERLFGSREERQILLEHTRRAIDFAEAIGCTNLVFGCPKNRTLPDGADPAVGIAFFREIAEYASKAGAVLALEANPPIYGTNFINTTREAFEMAELVGSPGFQVNLDLGTMIECRESASELAGRVSLVHHVHVSEPGLGEIRPRPLHEEILKALQGAQYNGYLSLEMRDTGDENSLLRSIACVCRSFSEGV